MPNIRHYDLSTGEAKEFTPETQTGYGDPRAMPMPMSGELRLNGVKVRPEDHLPKTWTEG